MSRKEQSNEKRRLFGFAALVQQQVAAPASVVVEASNCCYSACCLFVHLLVNQRATSPPSPLPIALFNNLVVLPMIGHTLRGTLCCSKRTKHSEFSTAPGS